MKDLKKENLMDKSKCIGQTSAGMAEGDFIITKLITGLDLLSIHCTISE